MDITKIKLPIAVIGIILAQAFGIIWYVAQLDSTVSNLDSSVVELQNVVETFDERLDDIEKQQAIIENEMRTIMSDHQNFNAVLRDLGKEGYGDNREYGDYGQ
jgi:hypothetical protein